MIRKADKYLLLFLIMICLRLTLNAERLTRITLPTTNCQPSTVNRQLNRDTLPFSKPDTLPSGVIIIPPTQGRLYTIGNIFIHGNRVTKAYIITREIPFKTGDSLTLQQLSSYFIQAREHLINTKLFNEAIVSLKEFRGY